MGYARSVDEVMSVGVGINQLCSGFGRSPHSTILGQLTHLMLHFPLSEGRRAHCEVGEVLGGGL